ncbi:quinone oxidoreductase family protein [Phenylobacterium immobile]|uniref:quinone oxidoreductase family protein n=1 Tax=Phenylobacterium immobile TaxID=21 RepID=UPI000A709962|nr:quinone oxidoreductase [Phenylobacterium immobile]
MKAYRLHAFEGLAGLRFEDVEVPTPGPGEVLIRQTAIGVNFSEVSRLVGRYPGPPLPSGIGMEGAGVVEALGEGVTRFALGDRIVGLGGPSYSEKRVAAADRAVIIPPEVSDDVAAAAFGKGLTAAYLVEKAYAIRPGDTVLVHAAAGGVGQVLCQWAKALGARVIGTAGSPEKLDFALAHGCDAAIDYREDDFVARVKELTDGQGVEVVYDSVGKDTFMGSLDCLKLRGTMVSYGSASGPVPPLDIALLGQKGSLTVKRASLPHYLVTGADIQAAAAALMARLVDGSITVRIDKVYPLAEAPQALADMGGRTTIGSLVLRP